MTEVVAGIIEREGKLLVCQRRSDQPHPDKWEFPGGKMEPGESPGQALSRELKEELDIEATMGPELMRYEFQYAAKKPILLIFLSVAAYSGALRNRIFAQTQWCEVSRLGEIDLLEGDEKFVARYKETKAEREITAPSS